MYLPVFAKATAVARPIAPVAPVMRTSLWERVSVLTLRLLERSGMIAAEERFEVGPIVEVLLGFAEADCVEERSDMVSGLVSRYVTSLRSSLANEWCEEAKTWNGESQCKDEVGVFTDICSRYLRLYRYLAK